MEHFYLTQAGRTCLRWSVKDWTRRTRPQKQEQKTESRWMEGGAQVFQFLVAKIRFSRFCRGRGADGRND